MAKEIRNKSVSFNLVDPFQKQMKDYAEQYPNFSAYVKRLIQRDMEEGTKVRSIKKAPSQVVSNLSMTQLNGIKL
ncbi:hypothetical protein SAMN05444673_2613 [Bacillus sp. OV166]|uniref:hypothetical protein n=1 Tax=Bacillus sp. OV166 TaxID=1882763 RepID=UPI000A2AB4B6|nr:hypothetical protein [Bacillus sp. OV166]SMQ76013.1 hypothetical protein SAMN05444673_2613 [Bacillus sp. OV166]